MPTKKEESVSSKITGVDSTSKSKKASSIESKVSKKKKDSKSSTSKVTTDTTSKIEQSENKEQSTTFAILGMSIGYLNFALFFIENIAFLFISAGIYKALNDDCYEKDGIKKKYVGLTYMCSGLTFVSQASWFVRIILFAILIASFFHVISYIFAAYGFWFANLMNVKVHAYLLVFSSFLLLTSLLVADISGANLNAYFNISMTVAIAILFLFIIENIVYFVSIFLLYNVITLGQTTQQ